MRKNLISSLLLLIFCVNKSSFSQSIALDSTQIDTTHIATNLRTVWEMIYGFDGDIWFTERIGKVSKVNPITKQKVTLLELSNVYHDAGAGSEAGLLGMALHPNMIDTPHVYIVYTYLASQSNWYNGMFNAIISLVCFPLVFWKEIGELFAEKRHGKRKGYL